MTASLRIRVSIATALALLLSACATTPQADARFGQSVRATFASQVMHPAAVRNTDPVQGVDGRAALGAQERYARKFESAPAAAAPALTIAK